MDTARFSETLASTNQSTRRIIPKDYHQVEELLFSAIECNRVNEVRRTEIRTKESSSFEVKIAMEN
jgi:hypothetical protein